MSKEPRNWFYTLLNFASLAFVVTALAYAIVPVLEQKAVGSPAPPSVFREALREHGWWILLVEVGLVVFLALAAMALDRWRQQPKDSLR